MSVFTDGPGPFTERLRSEGVELMLRSHIMILNSSLGDLVQAGFRPSQATIDHRLQSFAQDLSNLANEVAAWITQGDEERTVIAECAADVICALAVFHELLPRGGSTFTGEEFFAMTARFAMAGHLVGTYETMLTSARMGLVDEVDNARTKREAAQQAGRQGAGLRASDAEKWRRQARSDWAAYCGPLSKSAWAKRYASNYDRAWRTIFDALSDARDK